MSTDNNGKKYMYIASRDMNRDLFSKLVLRAKGDDRSLTEFARLCHVSTSTLSRIVNWENKAASRVEVIKAIAENAVEGSNVTFDMLMSANGYARVDMIDAEDLIGEQPTNYTIFGNDVEPFLDAIEAESDVHSVRAVRNRFFYELQKGEDQHEFYSKILQKHISGIRAFQSKESIEECKGLTIPFDFIIETDTLPADQKKWVFCIRDIGLEDVNRVFYEVFYILYLFQPKENQYKLTILMSQKRAFDKLCSMLQDVRIRDPFSVMLINTKTRRIVKEFIPDY